MGWRFWAADKSESQPSLEALQRDTTTDYGDCEDDELYVTLTSAPVDRAPGSSLSCLNEGRPIQVGDPCATLGTDERAAIVLEGTADLSDVYRTSCMMDPGTPATSRDGGFLVQVHTAQQQDKDVYVVGQALGQVVRGRRTVILPWTDREERFARIKAVEELPDGRIGVLVAKRDASTFEYGDEITYV